MLAEWQVDEQQSVFVQFVKNRFCKQLETYLFFL